MVIIKNLRSHTMDEHLWLIRRHMGLTQVEMAKQWDVSPKTYYRIENGLAEWSHPGTPLARPYRDGELCALARRRHGKTLVQTAADLGISHSTLLARERVSDPRLVTAWRGFGYRF